MTQALNALPDMRVVGRVGDGEALMELLANRRPDVLLLDIDMPGATGIEVLDRLDPPPPTLVVSMHAADADRRAAMEAGAMGFLSREGIPVDLAAAIRAVEAGEALDDAATLPAVSTGAEPRLDPGAAASPIGRGTCCAFSRRGHRHRRDGGNPLHLSEDGEKPPRQHLRQVGSQRPGPSGSRGHKVGDRLSGRLTVGYRSGDLCHRKGPDDTVTRTGVVGGFMAIWANLVAAWVRFKDSELGASLVEYALLVVVITIAPSPG